MQTVHPVHLGIFRSDQQEKLMLKLARNSAIAGAMAILLAANLAEAAVIYAFTGNVLVAPTGPDSSVTTTVNFSFSMTDFFDPGLTRSDFTASATKSFLVESVEFFESATSLIDGREYDMIEILVFRPDKGARVNFLFPVGTFDAAGSHHTGGFPVGDLVVSREPDVDNAAPEPASWAMLIAGLGAAGSAMRRGRRRPRASGCASAGTA